MKILLRALIFLPSFSFSQTTFFEYSDTPIINYGLTKIVSGENGFLYAVRSPQNAWPGWGEAGLIYKFDMSGNTHFGKSVMYGDATYLEDIVLAPDSSLVIAGFSQGCDWIPSRQGLLLKLNQLGDTFWIRSINPDTNFDFLDNHLRSVAALNDGSIVASADSTLYRADANGNLLWKITIPAPIHSLGTALNDNIYVSTGSGMYRLDTTGSILDFNPGYFYYAGMFSDSTYLFSAFGNLVKIDTAYSILSQFSFASTNFPASHIQIYRDTVWLTGTTSSDFTSLDPNLALIDTFRTQSTGVSVNSFCVYDSNLVVAGMETAHSNSLYTKLFSTSGNYDYYDLDLALLDVSFDTTWAYVYDPWPSICYLNFVPEILVQNNGTDTVHGFYLNSLSAASGVCGPLKRRVWINCNLLPGQSQAFVLDTTFEMLSCTATVPFCCWTTSPNLMVDKDHSNDYLCDSFIVDEIVFADAEADESMNFTVYPNPASSSFTVDADGKLLGSELEIFDALGRKKFSAIIKEKSTRIRASLAPGIYVVVVHSENQILSRKLVIE